MNSLRFAGFLCTILLLPATASAQPQQGDQWGRVPVTSQLLNQGDAVLQAVFHSTVRVNGATATYLGLFAGSPVLMTARHVMPDQDSCTGRTVTFYESPGQGGTLQKLPFTCDRLLGAWDQVEISLFSVATSAQSLALLESRGLKPGFDAPVSQFAELVTMGHGGEQNPQELLTVDQGPDCYVASASDDFRFRDGAIWSIALGCNDSAGDSGSPVVDRKSGALLGIVWGGHTDKLPELADSRYLRSLATSESPLLWEQLNYASPMRVVGAMFRYLLQNGQALDSQLRETLTDLLK